MREFKVPDFGEGVVEAEVLEWRVQEGDWVEEEQVLVDLLTDKAEIEIPSPCAGRVHRLHAEVGDIVPVGAVLIEIDEGSQAERESPVLSEAPAAPPTEREPRRETEPGAGQQPPAMPERPRSRQRASERHPGAIVHAVPAVRELARRLDVDLGQVRGTGPSGRIMRRDVEQFHAGRGAPGPEAEGLAGAVEDEPDWERRPLRGLRRAIARRMTLARRVAAHFTYVEEVDMTHLLERADAAGMTISPLAFIAHATIRALAGYELLNASIDDAREEIIVKRKVHLGIATATDDGLLVCVIRDTASLSPDELAASIEELATRARAGRLMPSDLRGSTFTITSLGKLGGIMSTPILNYPEVAILSVAAIRQVPAFVAGEVQARRMMNLSISVDHRIADGMVAAQFVRDIRDILERADFPDLSEKGKPQ
jgi:pyruvate dehydrogenase E2 component (dihydrolipoamide acetyltransferase)